MLKVLRVVCALLAVFAVALPARAQAPAAGASASVTSICGVDVPPPTVMPPAGSGPVVYQLAPCFDAQGGTSLVDVQTYLYYMQIKDHVSKPSQNPPLWVPYDDSIEQIMHEDFDRLWGTNFLDNLWIEVNDYDFPNGVVGKLITYHMEERQRIKIVDYTGSKEIEPSKIDDKLKEQGAQIRLDTFIDPGLVRKVEGVIRELMSEKGYEYAQVTHDIQELPGGPKLVHLTFHVDEGPIVKIRRVQFVGNTAMSGGKLRHQLKNNKPHGWLSFINGHGKYNEAQFDEDADRIVQFYGDHGYPRASVGVPQLQVIEDSEDGKTRWVELRVPISEGKQYRVGNITFAGNAVLKDDALRPLFKMKTGEVYSAEEIRKGYEQAREVYGTAGYFEFAGYPDFSFRDEPNPAEAQGQAPAALAAAPEAAERKGPPIVDITLRMQEGVQYFVNRISFVGNTTTHDNVIRREMRLYENGVFNTEALKYSIRRLNQLGYFKALQGPPTDVTITKTPDTTNKVDVQVKLEEQNRNQLSFGAGVSEFEGVFGQLSFQTANFLGRGESLTVSMQTGSRAKDYTLGFTEPFLLDRNITAGANVFRQDVRYIGAYTQRSTGANLTFGFPVADFTRMFANYEYQRVQVTQISDLLNQPELLARNPFLTDQLLVGQNGERIISKIVPSLVHNTLDNPIFPSSGRRLTLSLDLAGLGGNTSYYEPSVEAIQFWKQNARMSLGVRAQWQYIHPYNGTDTLPIFEKLFLGGEYSVRGFDIRSIGPQDPTTGIVLGGDKSLLFNVEQYFTIANPVRVLLFYDAGQVRDVGQPFGWKEDIVQQILPPLYDARTLPGSLTDPNAPAMPTTMIVGQRSAFKTSTGVEVRFMMPVLNVPFRLIFAYNPQRGGVLDNFLQPQKAFQFRFAVGSTF
jgi:outer membrane protein insertion porin family